MIFTNELIEQAERVRSEDLTAARKSAKWPEAVEFLKVELPEYDKALIRRAIESPPDEFGWVAPYHFVWGMSIRNRLRDAGFGEDAFGIQNLDNVYAEIVEAAVAL